MNLFTISFAYIKNKKLNTFLNILLLAFGVGIIIFMLLILHQLETRFTNNGKGINMVVGAKGSPLQLILSSIYHIDYPTGNIPLSEANIISNNKRYVKKAIPLALGDSYEGFRIVGTNKDYVEHYEAEISDGRVWEKNMEATIGSDIAKITGLEVGSTFSGSHGLQQDSILEHKEQQYEVVGILKPSNTVLDRLILTNVESVWMVHEGHGGKKKATKTNLSDTTHHKKAQKTGMQKAEDEKEITALLVVYRNPLAAINLPRIVNAQSSLQAAAPAIEIARLFGLIGVGVEVIQYFALIIILIAGLSIFIALYSALKERQYDLAIMRTLGASRFTLFTQIIMEGLLLAFLGFCIGFVLAHGAVELTGRLMDTSSQILITGFLFLESEIVVLLVVLWVALLASLLPAIQTYRIDISKILAK